MKFAMKTCSVFIAFILLLSCLLSVSAKENINYGNAEKTMRAFGIINDDKSLDAKVTYAEFTVLVMRALGLSEVAKSMEESGENAHWANGYERLAREMGLYTGYSAFLPDDNVTPTFAITVLVNALGYTILTKDDVGSPEAFIQVGVAQGITKGTIIDWKGDLIRGDAYVWLANALDIPVLVKTGYGSKEQYETNKNSTLRENLYSINNREYIKGIVEANSLTSIYGVSTLEKGEVIIDGVLYDAGNTAAENFLGCYVELYADRNEDTNQYEIKWIQEHKKSTVIDLDSEGVVSFQNGKLCYYANENQDDEEEVEVPDSASLIFNNKAVTIYSGAKFDFSDGRFTLIDNNDDGVIDVVMVVTIQNFLVDRIYDDSIIYIKNGTFHSKKSIELKPNEKDYTVALENQNGDAIEIGEITPGSAISVQASQDNTYIKVILNKEIVKGQPTEIVSDDGYVVIEGKNYKFLKGAEGIEINAYGTFYLDAWGRIFHFEKSIFEYAYLYRVNFEVGSLDKNVMIKLFTADKEFKIFELADNAMIDGVNLKKIQNIQSAINDSAVVEFKVNGEGKVSQLNYCDVYAEKGERYYRKYAGGFNDPENKLRSIVYDQDEALLFFIPKNGEEEDFYCDFPLEDNDKYVTCGYSFDENENSVRVLTIEMDTDMPFASGIISRGNILAVDQIKAVVNHKDNVTYRVSGWTDGKYITLEMAQRQEVLNIASDLECGDVMQYLLDWNGQVMRLQVLLDPSTLDKHSFVNEGKSNEGLYGVVNDINMNELTNLREWRTHEIAVTVDGSKDIYKYVSSSPDGNGSDKDKGFNRYFVYDVKRNKVKLGRIEDIITQKVSQTDASCVYIGSRYGNVQFIMIFTNTD